MKTQMKVRSVTLQCALIGFPLFYKKAVHIWPRDRSPLCQKCNGIGVVLLLPPMKDNGVENSFSSVP